MSIKGIKTVFLIAALYDIILGIVFGLFFKPVYNSFGAELPNHAGYIQLAAAYILVFGIGFYLVYKDPVRNQAIITLGILMKLVFVVIVLGHLLIDTIPPFYIPFALLDVVFLLLFLYTQTAIKKLATTK
jgi:hypothetical protein